MNNLLLLRRILKTIKRNEIEEKNVAMALIRARHGINKRRRRRQLPLTVIRAMCDNETEEFIIITRRHSLGTSRREQKLRVEGKL